MVLRLSDPHDRGVVARVLAILRRRPQPLPMGRAVARAVKRALGIS